MTSRVAPAVVGGHSLGYTIWISSSTPILPGAQPSRAARAANRSRPGASSWQSLARGTGSIEADYLNGEIVLLGRLFGVPTPVNLLLQQLAAAAAREGDRPGSLEVDELIRMLPPDE